MSSAPYCSSKPNAEALARPPQRDGLGAGQRLLGQGSLRHTRQLGRLACVLRASMVESERLQFIARTVGRLRRIIKHSALVRSAAHWLLALSPCTGSAPGCVDPTNDGSTMPTHVRAAAGPNRARDLGSSKNEGLARVSHADTRAPARSHALAGAHTRARETRARPSSRAPASMTLACAPSLEPCASPSRVKAAATRRADAADKRHAPCAD